MIRRATAALVLVVGLSLCVYVTVQVFSQGDVSAGTNTAYGMFAGTLLTGVWRTYRFIEKQRGADVRNR